MAKYKVGSQAHYRLGVYTKPGEIVELPDNELPSVTWEPLDDAAKVALAALKKAKKDGKLPDGFLAGPEAEVVAKPAPVEEKTLGEIAKSDAAKGKRASDKSV